MDGVYYPYNQKNRKFSYAKKIILVLSVFLLVSAFSYGIFFLYKIHVTGKKINANAGSDVSFLQTVKSLAADNPLNIKSADPNRINILLLGIAGKGKPGQNLTDTIMIASINKKTGQIALLSIPRDLYMTIATANFQGKINSAYQFGLNNSGKNDSEIMDPLLKAVEILSSLNMDYYVVLNFDGFQKSIDDIGGINIISERDIRDTRYPGPNYSYEIFELSKGFHHLDGATALKYARERHDDPEGDFGRAKRQQQIMQATKNKIFSASTLFNPIALNNLLDTLGDNIVTDITPDEMGGFLELAKKLDTQNITNVVLDAWNKESLLKVIHIGQAFALVPRVGNWSEVQDLAQNIFDLNKLKRTREEIAEEDATILIMDKSGDAKILAKIKKLLSDNLDYKNVITAYSSDKTLAENTTVYDLTNGTKPFTANELVTKLPATISYNSSSAPAINSGSQKTDIIVVIGKDLIDRYNMEEGTLQDLNSERDNQDSQGFVKD